MKVYLLMEGSEAFDGQEVVRVYATTEAANRERARSEAFVALRNPYGAWYEVEEWEVEE